VNHYGAKALGHWQAHLPGPLAQVPDQEAFFTLLGETAETEIALLAESLASLKPEADEYLKETARLETARRMAEMEITRDMILVDPAAPEKVARLLQLA
jgi:hypothetical protein